MKHLDHIIFAATITLLIFTATIYTSCKKDACANFFCQNNGTCANGTCVCPVPFTGAHCDQVSSTSVIFKNHAPRPFTVMVGNNTKIVASGDSVSFQGPAYSSIYANIVSADPYVNNILFYLYYSLNYPASGALVQDLDVPATTFFLQVKNTSAYTVTTVVVYVRNNHFSYNTTIANDGVSHPIGYFDYDPGTTSVQLICAAKTWDLTNLNLPNTADQVATVTAN